MDTLHEFLVNGRLPFVGRGDQTDRMVAFVAATVDTRGLRIALVTGEAGAGKSRFLEELIPRLEQGRHLVLHVKFHPESNISIASLLAHSLRQANLRHHVLKGEPDESLASVIAALRRCSRLRPTLLLLEDVEQLQGDSVAELQSLVTALADESISIVCVARPVELDVRGVLERYLVEEIHLGSLAPDDVRMAWSRMFGSPPTDAVLEAVMSATHGNALALRAALRGAAQSGALLCDEQSGEWRLTVPPESFTSLLQQNVRVVSQGLAAHLSNEEKIAASSLAILGEVFSREAAAFVLEEPEAMLERLMLKGIIATSTTSVISVNLRSSASAPLAFTHTLTHQRLAERTTVGPDLLVGVIAAAPPIYSILPFQSLRDRAGAIGTGCRDVRRAVEESLTVARILDRTAAWQKRTIPWGAATAMISRFVAEWDAAECIDVQALLLRYDLFLHARNPVDQRQLVDRILSFTARRRTREMSEARIAALGHLLREHPDAADDIFEDADMMLERHPDLIGTPSYAYFLGLACEALAPTPDLARRHHLEERLERSYASSRLDDEGGRQVLDSYLGLVSIFANDEELDRRFELLTHIATESPLHVGRATFERAKLLLETGRVREALAAIERSMRYVEERGMREEVWKLRSLRIAALAILERETAAVVREATELLDEIPEGRIADHRRSLAELLVTIALLRGDAAWAGEIASVVGRAQRARPGRPQQALEHLVEQPILRLSDLLRLIEAIEGESDDPADLELLRGGVRKTLDWLFDPSRELDRVIAPTLERFAHFLSEEELRSLREKLAALLSEREGDQEEEREAELVSVSMLGSIEVRLPGRDPQRISGLRLRTTLGLLVANQMLREPLEYEEFCRLAAGTIAYDKATRVATNGIIWRLRDVVGREAIDTGGEIPELDRKIVRVDLLDAHDLLDDASAAMRDGLLVRAVTSLSSALEITAGKVPFPTLYDDFFEALRADLDARLHRAISTLSRELMREGDHDGAASLLRNGLDILPGDGELDELLHDALLRAGHATEAERVRSRA